MLCAIDPQGCLHIIDESHRPSPPTPLAWFHGLLYFCRFRGDGVFRLLIRQFDAWRIERRELDKALPGLGAVGVSRLIDLPSQFAAEAVYHSCLVHGPTSRNPERRE